VLGDLRVGGAAQQQDRLPLEGQPLPEARDLPARRRDGGAPDLDVVAVLGREGVQIGQQVHEASPGVVDDLGREPRRASKFDRS
jgi:hypothetical protein